MFLFKVCFLRELPLDSPWVTLISSNYFFTQNVSFTNIYFCIICLRQCRRKDTFDLKAQLYFRNAFFFFQSFSTVFNLALLRELQNRLWKLTFTVFIVLSFHNSGFECISSYVSPWPMILLFCFDMFGQNIHFTWKNII